MGCFGPAGNCCYFNTQSRTALNVSTASAIVVACSTFRSFAWTPSCQPPPMPRVGDAAVDLIARTSAVLAPGGGRALVPAGIALAIPAGYAALVLPRDSLAVQHGVTCLNAPGLIDSAYRGEVKVLLVNTDPTNEFKVNRGQRIAWLVVTTVEHVLFTEVQDL